MDTISDKLEAEDMWFSYEGGNEILKGVGIEIKSSTILGIIGPNGSGKTTFMKCLNRILTPDKGAIYLNGEDIKHISRKKMAQTLGYVPQCSQKDMSSPNVYTVVMMGRRPYMSWHFTEKDDEVVWEIMKNLDIAHLASHSFDDLSSGQTQRVLIARAIAQEAKIFLLDEPTSNLDIRYQMEVMNLVKDTVSKKGVSACAIIHDLDLAMRFCDHIVMMSDGHIAAAGIPREVLTPENIKAVYGVNAVIEHSYGRDRVIIL